MGGEGGREECGWGGRERGVWVVREEERSVGGKEGNL